MSDKLQMVITMKVDGKEGLDVVLTYKDTTIETVKLVENALLQTFINLNK